MPWQGPCFSTGSGNSGIERMKTSGIAASGLNLVVAAIVLWNTVYLEQAVAAIRQSGQAVSDETLAHLSPLKWEHINLTGDYHWRKDAGLQDGKLRPLRVSKP